MTERAEINSILLLVLSIFPVVSGAATITVQPDRNPVVLQESFQLLFEAAGKVDGDPDFSPLEKDFQVLSTSTSTSMNIVNTNITRIKQWRLTLLPLKSGNLTIPAIAFGKDKSPQTNLTVEQQRAASTGPDAPDIFIEVEAAPEAAYVQAEVVYTIKLYRSVATANETLSEPAMSAGSAIVEQLDADRSYDTVIKGRRYAVFARSYGIYPQVSGNLLIPPVRFQAQLSSTSPFSLDPFSGGTKTVVRQSEPVELQVEPIPAAWRGGHWLPAAHVQIAEEWSANPLELLPGEPVTRTLALSAQGLTSSQLPELEELFPGDFRQYPDMPVLENTGSADGMTAVRRQKSAIIPAQAGEYTLPEISLPWWNTETQTMENAVLPERRGRGGGRAAAPPASRAGRAPPSHA
ncbi:MAG: BatD family protein, partial [Gammaproteobacteria bacterium]|nr:BatD family protein [Gammaproteobacteria bacterium]